MDKKVNTITKFTIVWETRIYYNFRRPYMALKGKTPAEMAKVLPKLEKNKWKNLIKKAHSMISQR